MLKKGSGHIVNFLLFSLFVSDFIKVSMSSALGMTGVAQMGKHGMNICLVFY